MKTTIDILPASNTFPLLARNQHSNYVVLFTSERQGTVVHLAGCSFYSLGHVDTDWSSCFDDRVWEILPSGTSVTLRQE